MRRDDLNHVAVYHREACYTKHCRAAAGDLLIETWNRGKASVDIEWLASKKRVDDPRDHAGQCIRWGPDITGETTYP
jgi:hypothetical protein